MSATMARWPSSTELAAVYIRALVLPPASFSASCSCSAPPVSGQLVGTFGDKYLLVQTAVVLQLVPMLPQVPERQLPVKTASTEKVWVVGMPSKAVHVIRGL